MSDRKITANVEDAVFTQFSNVFMWGERSVTLNRMVQWLIACHAVMPEAEFFGAVRAGKFDDLYSEVPTDDN